MFAYPLKSAVPHSRDNRLTTRFHAYGFTYVSFGVFGSSLIRQGPVGTQPFSLGTTTAQPDSPCSMNKPMAELAPAPPLIHITTGSVLGSLRDSNK